MAPRIGPEATLNGPKRAAERAQRVAVVPKVPPVRPKEATKRWGPDRGPLGAVRGRFGPFWAQPRTPPTTPTPHPLAGAAPGAWRIVLARNSGFGQATGGGTWGRSCGPEPEPEPEPWDFCFCHVLLLLLLALIMGRGV